MMMEGKTKKEEEKEEEKRGERARMAENHERNLRGKGYTLHV